MWAGSWVDLVARDYNGKSKVRKSGGDWGLVWLQWAWRQSRQNLLRGGAPGKGLERRVIAEMTFTEATGRWR